MQKVTFLLVAVILSVSGFAYAQNPTTESYQNIDRVCESEENFVTEGGVTDLQMVMAAYCGQLGKLKEFAKMGGNLNAKANVYFVVRRYTEYARVWIHNASPFIVTALQQNEDLIDYFAKKSKKGEVEADYQAQIKMDPIWTFEKIDALGAIGSGICDARAQKQCIIPQRKLLKKIAAVSGNKSSNALLWAIRGGDKVSLSYLHNRGYSFDGQLGPFNALQIAVATPFVEANDGFTGRMVRPIGRSLHEDAVRWLTNKGVTTDARTAALALSFDKVFKANWATYPQSILSTVTKDTDKEEVKGILKELCSKGAPAVFTAPPFSDSPANENQVALAAAAGSI